MSVQSKKSKPVKLSYSNKISKITYDISTKIAYSQTFIERRKVITNELNEEESPEEYKIDIEQNLITNEITRLHEVIWNCKNTIRFSQDKLNIITKEKQRLEDSTNKIELLTTFLN